MYLHWGQEGLGSDFIVWRGLPRPGEGDPHKGRSQCKGHGADAQGFPRQTRRPGELELSTHEGSEGRHSRRSLVSCPGKGVGRMTWPEVPFFFPSFKLFSLNFFIIVDLQCSVNFCSTAK